MLESIPEYRFGPTKVLNDLSTRQYEKDTKAALMKISRLKNTVIWANIQANDSRIKHRSALEQRLDIGDVIKSLLQSLSKNDDDEPTFEKVEQLKRLY
jgi:hypothetical protein